MLCSFTIQPAVSLRSGLACIPISRLGALHTLAEEGAPMDFTDRSGRIGEAEELDHIWSPFCMPTDRDRLAFTRLWRYAFAGVSRTLWHLYERQARCICTLLCYV